MSTAAQTSRVLAPAAWRPRVIAPKPEIALLVSTYQRPWHLRQVLTSIAEQEGVEHRAEVVVTDDGSTDETFGVVDEFARSVRFPVSLTTHPHESFQLARCRNEGVAASTADYLLFLDGDCVLPPDHVIEHLKHRRDNRVMGGYCCRLDAATSRRFDEASIRSQAYRDWIPRRELRSLSKRDRKARFYRMIHHPTKPKLAGGNIGIWRRDYERVNGYDENFYGWGGEDDDLRFRLRKLGVGIDSILRFTHTYHLWHPPTPSTPQRRRDGDNEKYLHRTYRLTRCLNGLVKRGPDDLAIGLVGATSRPEAAGRLLKSCRIDAGDHRRAEVELLMLPGRGRFSGRADVNLLVVLEDTPRAARLARRAHMVVAERTYPSAAEHFRPDEFDRALKAIR